MWFKDKWYNYFAPLHKSINMQFNPDCWAKSLKLSEQEKYRESFENGKWIVMGLYHEI